MFRSLLFLVIFEFAFSYHTNAQFGHNVEWSRDGNSYYESAYGGIIKVHLPDRKETTLVNRSNLKPAGSRLKLLIENFTLSVDEQSILIFSNSHKVWQYNLSGDYWIYRIKDSSLFQLGKSLPAGSLMFAKISPDGKMAAYVSNYNLYVERLDDGQIKPLTTDGNRKFINGTFDYLYDLEFDCRDGFRWSVDSKKIAYWQIDARALKDYAVANNTDSSYPVIIPQAYARAGEKPALSHIGVVDINTAVTTWMKIPTDSIMGSYITRMEWAHNSDELVLQKLNRLQNQSDLMMCNAGTGAAHTFYTEHDSAWIDIQSAWDDNYKMGGWDWLQNGNYFLWASEKDGWRHLYRISRDGKKEILLTNGPYDVIAISGIDESKGFVYFLASPDNATRAYLYRVRLDGKGKSELISPGYETGTHQYEVSPNGLYAKHIFSNHFIYQVSEWITLPDHKTVDASDPVAKALAKSPADSSGISFFTIPGNNGEPMDAMMAKPIPFDSTKKYPVVFYVYGGPAWQTVRDIYGVEYNDMYAGNMANDGYIYITIDNHGTPVPKGRAWRKSIFLRLGQLDVSDQAEAARQIRQWPFIDTNRIAIWGASNGGTETLNLIFRYPEIYKTGLAISAITDFSDYDDIYTEHVMGLPADNIKNYNAGSPVTYAKNLQGNLLICHGTGDVNVHYSHAEKLLNELMKYKKTFQFMPYPGASHSILYFNYFANKHLKMLYTGFLRANCPPGALNRQ